MKIFNIVAALVGSIAIILILIALRAQFISARILSSIDIASIASKEVNAEMVKKTTVGDYPHSFDVSALSTKEKAIDTALYYRANCVGADSLRENRIGRYVDTYILIISWSLLQADSVVALIYLESDLINKSRDANLFE